MALKILAVEDDHTNLMILEAMLAKEGHVVCTAKNGEEAVEVFSHQQPDIVLMDINMPVMNGYEATRLIKSKAGERFVPLIFLTATSDDQELAECVACGGDDFLTKPYSRVILQAKITAFERVSQLHASLKTQKDELDYHHKQLKWEQEVANRLFSNIVNRGDINAANIKHLLSSASIFSGDLVLAANKPSGGLHALLGDFTGHGLSSALGAIPVSETFYAMTAKGFSIGDIVAEINSKLKSILPTGLFFAACFLDLDTESHSVAIWNGGIPDVLIYREQSGIHKRVPSRHLPLAIVDNDKLLTKPDVVEIMSGDRICIYSDGVIEACNEKEELFGQKRLEELFNNNSNPDNLFDEICSNLDSFGAGVPQRDDITLLEIKHEATPACTANVAGKKIAKSPMNWRMSLEMEPDTLRMVDPLPLLMQALVEIQGLSEHKDRLFMVLKELYSNALEHGLLGLDSAQKESPQGFTDYYAAREEKLAALQKGRIKFSLDHTPLPTGAKLVIRVEDNGPGFDYHRRFVELDCNEAYCGRGIPLVRSLCKELAYHGNGNRVEAVYVWE